MQSNSENSLSSSNSLRLLHGPPVAGLTGPSFSVRVCSCWRAAFSSTSPLVTGGKDSFSRQESIDSAAARKSGGGERGEAVNGRVSRRRRRAVQTWDLPIWSFYFHNRISLSCFLFFFSSLLAQGPDVSIFLPLFDSVCVERHLLHPTISAGNLLPSEAGSA